MKILNPSTLCKCEYVENVENNGSTVAVFSEVDEFAYTNCCASLIGDGFEKREEYAQGTHHFCALSKDGYGVFVNYFGGAREMYVVEEENTRYFDYSDRCADRAVSPQITQISLEDFGMSYAIRLSDGRFIVIDGGREFEPDADKLFKVLSSGSGGVSPVIAAWIMTHPHSDHFHCFMPFMDKYADRVTVEKFILNFPEHDDLDHYPSLADKEKQFADSSATTNIPLMYERIDKTGATVYTAHTGQRYVIGDASCDVLTSMDDTIHLSSNVNASSLVIRMELGGQTVLLAADAAFEQARLAAKYADYLKSDILQVPHHGFGSGSVSEQKKCFELISPSVCLLPVSDYNAYTMFCTYREGTRYLMNMPCVREMITGSVQRTITLPYTAPEWAKAELEHKFIAGRANGGSKTWVYSDLSTADPEDFEFTFLNMVNANANVSIDLFFEDRANNVRYIKVQLPGNSIRRVCIIGDDVDGDAVYYNWMSLSELGVPENAAFAARFMSDVPIVVSHKKHTAAYHSGVV